MNKELTEKIKEALLSGGYVDSETLEHLEHILGINPSYLSFGKLEEYYLIGFSIDDKTLCKQHSLNIYFQLEPDKDASESIFESILNEIWYEIYEDPHKHITKIFGRKMDLVSNGSGFYYKNSGFGELTLCLPNITKEKTQDYILKAFEIAYNQIKKLGIEKR